MRRFVGRMLLCALAWVGAARAAPTAELQRAVEQVGAKRFADAARTLDGVWRQDGLDRDSVLLVLELQGIVAAQSSQNAKAVQLFRTLLALDPEHRLEGQPPKVESRFQEARRWIMADQEPLRFVAQPPALNKGKVSRIGAALKSDPLKLGKKVRLHLRTADSGGWDDLELPLTQGAAGIAIDADVVEWWAELLGERDMVLAVLGSEKAPQVDSASPKLAKRVEEQPTTPPVVAEVPRDAPVRPKEIEVAPVAREDLVRDHPGSPLRTYAYVSIGAAVAAVAAGGYFGLQSADARRKVETAEVDEQGRVTGMTQKEAARLDEQARGQAVIANALFGTAGALAITGGILWFLGDDSVSVTTDGSGLMIRGELP